MTTVVPDHKNVSHSFKINDQAKILTANNVLTMATAVLEKSGLGTGSEPDQALKPHGWFSGLCPTHHQRGHLVGNTLGGTGESLDNLVTLTAGSNHPFMFAIEGKIKRYVCDNPGKFMYVVKAIYVGYEMVEIAKGFWVPAAMSNPFCLFPAPAYLDMALRPFTEDGPPAWITLGEICSKYEDPVKALGHSMAAATVWRIPNGGYKLNTSEYHAGFCSAKSKLEPHINKSQSAAFVEYATHLGYS